MAEIPKDSGSAANMNPLVRRRNQSTNGFNNWNNAYKRV